MADPGHADSTAHAEGDAGGQEDVLAIIRQLIAEELGAGPAALQRRMPDRDRAEEGERDAAADGRGEDAVVAGDTASAGSDAERGAAAADGALQEAAAATPTDGTAPFVREGDDPVAKAEMAQAESGSTHQPLVLTPALRVADEEPAPGEVADRESGESSPREPLHRPPHAPVAGGVAEGQTATAAAEASAGPGGVRPGESRDDMTEDESHRGGDSLERAGRQEVADPPSGRAGHAAIAEAGSADGTRDGPDDAMTAPDDEAGRSGEEPEIGDGAASSAPSEVAGASPGEGEAAAATSMPAAGADGPGARPGIDPETLRPVVAALVREELMGELGDRITRNVRKLVRREINRILASRDFE